MTFTRDTWPLMQHPTFLEFATECRAVAARMTGVDLCDKLRDAASACDECAVALAAVEHSVSALSKNLWRITDRDYDALLAKCPDALVIKLKAARIAR